MARSIKKSLTITHPLNDGLEKQIADGTIDYPSTNAAHNGLVLYQLLSGKEHPITSKIAYMHADHQDAIHDFARELTERKLSVMGSFIRRVAERVVAGEAEPDPEEIERKHADQILEWALRWQRGDESVWEEVDIANS
jgi:acetate kinase